MLGPGVFTLEIGGGVVGSYVQLWHRCFRQSIDSDDVFLDPSGHCIRVWTKDVLVLCSRVASCSVSERSGVVAVLSKGDVGSAVTCAECYDGSCICTPALKYRSQLSGRGGWPALRGRESRLPGQQTTRCILSALGTGSRYPSVWAV